MLEKGELKACLSNACKRELEQGPVIARTISTGSASYAADFRQASATFRGMRCCVSLTPAMLATFLQDARPFKPGIKAAGGARTRPTGTSWGRTNPRTSADG